MNNFTWLKCGARVSTPSGQGQIVYWRMRAPDYSTPEAVSVCLDVWRYQQGYTGTIFAAGDIQPA